MSNIPAIFHANRMYHVQPKTIPGPSYSSPMTNTQSSGIHVLKINSNGASSIIYWIIGLYSAYVWLQGDLGLVSPSPSPRYATTSTFGTGQAWRKEHLHQEAISRKY